MIRTMNEYITAARTIQKLQTAADKLPKMQYTTACAALNNASYYLTEALANNNENNEYVGKLRVSTAWTAMTECIRLANTIVYPVAVTEPTNNYANNNYVGRSPFRNIYDGNGVFLS